MNLTRVDDGTSGHRIWFRMLWLSWVCSLSLSCVLLFAAFYRDGVTALSAVLLGSFVVCAVFTVSLVVLWWASRYSPAVIGVAMVLLYGVLVLVGAMVLAVVPPVRTAAAGWVGGTASAQIVLWLSVLAYSMRRARLPVFDVQLPGGTQK